MQKAKVPNSPGWKKNTHIKANCIHCSQYHAAKTDRRMSVQSSVQFLLPKWQSKISDIAKKFQPKNPLHDRGKQLSHGLRYFFPPAFPFVFFFSEVSFRFLLLSMFLKERNNEHLLNLNRDFPFPGSISGQVGHDVLRLWEWEVPHTGRSPHGRGSPRGRELTGKGQVALHTNCMKLHELGIRMGR